MNYSRIYAVFKMEFLHIRRDLRSLINTFILPILLLFLLAYVLHADVRGLTLGVYDADRTSQSRYFLQVLEHSSFFRLRIGSDPRELRDWLRKGLVGGTVVVPENFSSELLRGLPAPVDFAVDEVMPSGARIYLNYLDAVSLAYPFLAVDQSYFLSFLEPTAGVEAPMKIRFQTLFNPTYDRFAFMIPAILGCLLMSIFPIPAANAIVREKEGGSFNLVLASPASPLEFLAGKFFAYFLVALAQFALLTAIGVFWFQVPFRGSLAEYFLVTLVFISWTVAFGLLISVFAGNQLTALTAATLTLLPAFIFSGIYFPVETIAMPIRLITYAVPAQYLVSIARQIFLKGTHLADWWESFAGLCLIAAATFVVTYLRVKRMERR